MLLFPRSSRAASPGIFAVAALFAGCFATRAAGAEEAAGIPTASAVEVGAPPQVATAEETATRLFTEGTEAFVQQNFALALEKFQESFRLAPSPNSQYMLGRTLVQLSRRDEAATALYAAADSARLKAVSEPRYKQTADAASGELARLRTQLALVRVRALASASGDGAALRVGGVEHPIDPSGEAVIFREPGEVVVELVLGGSIKASKTIRVDAGMEGLVELAVADVAGAKSSLDWKLGGAIGAGGFGVVGLAMFAGFGASSTSIHSELEEGCAPFCGAAAREKADRGELHGTIANAMLGVGVVGLAVGGTLYYLHATDDDAKAPASVAVALGPTWLGVEGRF